jgi:hypothetical protein
MPWASRVPAGGFNTVLVNISLEKMNLPMSCLFRSQKLRRPNVAIRGTLLQSFQIETLRHGPIILTRQKLENQIVADAIQPAGLTWLTGLAWLAWLAQPGAQTACLVSARRSASGTKDSNGAV